MRDEGSSARRPTTVWKATLSAVIVVTLGLQTLAAFKWAPGPIEPPPFLFPFLNYGMYSRVHAPGTPIRRIHVVALTPDGERTLTPDDVGLNFWTYQWGFVDAIRYEQRDRLTLYAEAVERRTGLRPTGFRVEDRPALLTRDGIADGATKVLYTVTLGRNGGDQ